MMAARPDMDEIRRQRDVILSPAICAIMEKPGQMIFIKNADLVYLAANEEFLKITRCNSEKELVGLTDRDIFENQAIAEAYVAKDKRYIDAAAPAHLEFTELYSREDGTSGTCLAQEFLLFDKDRKVIALMGIVRDLKDSQQAPLKAAGKTDTLAKAYDAHLVREITQYIINTKDTDRIIPTVLGLLGKSLKVSRVYIFEDDETHECCKNTYEWCAKGVKPLQDQLQRVSYARDLDGYLDLYDKRGIVAITDTHVLAAGLGRTAALHQTRSILHCALYDNDKFTGFIGFEDCDEPRAWSEEEIGTLWMIARLVALIVVRERHKKLAWISEDYLAIGNIFSASYRLDLSEMSYTEIKAIPWLHNKLGYRGQAADFLAVLPTIVSKGFRDGFRAFLNPANLEERLAGSSFISYEFLSGDDVWLRASLIPVSTDEDDKLACVIVGVVVIDKEKRLELQAQETLKTSLILKEQNEVLDRAVLESSDFVAVIDATSGLITLETGTWYAKGVQTPDEEKKISVDALMSLLLERFIPNEHKRAEFEQAVELSHVVDMLEKNSEYIVTFDFQEQDKTTKSKQYRYTWLNRDKSLILYVRTDITQAIKERKKIQTDIEILRQAALDADDFVAIIDCKSSEIELRNGSWFSRDVPTPEKLVKISYPELLAYVGKNYCLNKEEGTKFERLLCLDTVVSTLMEQPDLVIPYNFFDAKNKTTIKRKQFRFIWLDHKKTKIILTGTDITQSFKKDQQLILDDLIIKKSALDNVDFVAVLDPDDGDITLRLGNWVSGVPTPPSQRKIPYTQLLSMGSTYTTAESENSKFYDAFSVDSVTRRLSAGDEIIIYFDFVIPADNNAVHKKQLRYTWLDNEKHKILVTRTDITKSVAEEQKRNTELKDALNAAQQASQAKTSFFSRMSHDIRTPMNAIIGFSTLMLQDADDSERVKEEAKKILVSGNHLLGLINDVLDMSKIESGKLTISTDKFLLSDVLSMIDSIMRPQMEAKDQNFEMYVSDVRHESLISDRNRLQQVLINLLSNATKYTDKNGAITLRVHGLPQSSGHVENISFEIKDNGRGMSQSYQKMLFTPFTREDQGYGEASQGTGLGLAITRNLVSMMGGTISVKSTLGVGSTFTVVLPFEVYDSGEESAFWKKHSLTHMLAVDDEREVLDNIASSMEDTGVRLALAEGGRQAVETIEQAEETGDEFDIVLVDWKMPDMDGVECARQIRAEVSSDVLIIILTAYDYTTIEDEARRAGVDAFMQKPFFPYSLMRTVQDARHAEDADEAREREGQSGTRVSEDSASSEEDTLDGLRVLAAEDNALNAEVLKEILKRHKASVEVEPDGKAVLERFEREKEGTFDLILMDVQMPVMNGYEATQAIRALERRDAADIPIFAMTANAFNEDVQKCLLAGMNAHIAKPLDIEVLKERVAEFVRKPADD